MPIAITTDFGATRDEVLIRRITAGETHLFPELVQPYVRGLATSPVDDWPGELAPAQLYLLEH